MEKNDGSKKFLQPMNAEDAWEKFAGIENRISEHLENIDEMTSQLEDYIERINELKGSKENQ